jgi:hypothetical protein
MRKFVRGTLINLCAYNKKSAVKAGAREISRGH